MACFTRTISLIVIIAMASCSRHSRVHPDKILAVYPVFQDSSEFHQRGYMLDNGMVVNYDRENLYVKEYLKNNLTKVDSFPKDPDTKRIMALLQNKKTFKPVPVPIKVLPFREFGYLKTSDGKIIMYGLWTSAFYDLTHNLITN